MITLQAATDVRLPVWVTRQCSALVASCAACLLVICVAATPASAAPTAGWTVRALAEPSVFSAGDALECQAEEKCDRYQLLVQNVGDAHSKGVVRLTDVLPAGITTLETKVGIGPEEEGWSCNSGPGQSTVVCELPEYEGVEKGAYAPYVSIVVSAPANDAQRTLKNVVTVESEGAPTASSTLETTANGPAPAFSVNEFQVLPGEESGAPSSQAAGHPWEVTTNLGVPSVLTPPGNTETNGPNFEAVKSVKSVIVELPLGFFGNTLSATSPAHQCTETQLRNERCPPESRVGTLAFAATFSSSGAFLFTEDEAEKGAATAVYNMRPEAGYPAEFGFVFSSNALILYATAVHTPSGYRLRIVVPGEPQIVGAWDSSLTFFGQPGQLNGTGSTATFLTNPADCGAKNLSARAELTAWSDPEHPVSAETTAYPEITGCDVLQFNPSLSFEPSPGTESEPGTTQADTPSAYTAVLKVPQKEAFESQATPELRTATVTLPPGTTLNPAAAQGLAGCPAEGSEGINIGSSDIGAAGQDLGDPDATELGAGHEGGDGSPYDDGFWHTAPGHCPPASTVGTAEVITPLLPAPLKGHVYVALPKCGGEGQPACTEASATNGELFGAYLEVSGSGVIVKLKGTLAANPTTGQITASFTENPQLPFTEVKLHIHGGPRAPFANPQTCGTATTSSSLEPWSETAPALVNSSFAVTGCPAGAMPFAPSFTAGTTGTQAGGSSPFVLSFSRKDGEQDFTGLSETMPPGLIGKITGIPQCEEAQANAGTCGPESQVGVSNVLAGSGPDPLPVGGGRVYLTGPYQGAPFGLSIVVPAKAGPFNLGNEVIRAKIEINPATAQVTVVTNPIPQVKDGVQFRLKTVNTEINRPGFILNPTSCAPQSITGSIQGSQGASAAVSSPFQATGCGSLGFKPQLTASTEGKTSKQNGASLSVKIGFQPGDANIKKVELEIPKILPSRLTTLQKACTEAQFNSNPAGCPKESLIARAVAHTPLLPVPLEGPVYFVSHGGAAFPDTVMVLQGDNVTLDIVGQTDIKNGITYSRFETIPDAPVSSFEFTAPEGPFSIFGSNGNLCQTEVHMPTTITAQNGAVLKQSTLVEPEGCPNTITILSHKVKKRTITLKVAVPAAGRLTVAGKGLKAVSKTAGGRGIVTLTLKAKGHHRLNTKIKLTFTPKTGKHLSASVSARFRS